MLMAWGSLRRPSALGLHRPVNRDETRADCQDRPCAVVERRIHHQISSVTAKTGKLVGGSLIVLPVKVAVIRNR
jgi:hypothetical protein